MRQERLSGSKRRVKIGAARQKTHYKSQLRYKPRMNLQRASQIYKKDNFNVPVTYITTD